MSNVLISDDSKILKIGIDRAEKKNALTLDMYETMANAIENLNPEQSKVVLIYAQGDDFCAGNDISVFAQSDENMQANEARHFMQALMDCPVPIVVKVKGNAIGIGTTMLLHCDFVYAADNAVFWMPFVDLALVPEFASSFLIPSVAGDKKAAQWLLLADRFSADDAQQYGVITQSVKEHELDAVVDKTLSRLVDKPTNALMYTKKLLSHQKEETKKHMEKEFEIFFKQLVSVEAKKAFSAFLNKGKA